MDVLLDLHCQGGTSHETGEPSSHSALGFTSTFTAHENSLTATTLLCAWAKQNEAHLLSTCGLVHFTDADHNDRRVLSSPDFVHDSWFDLVTQDRLHVRLPGWRRPIGPIHLTARQSWFLELTRSLAFVLHIQDTKWFGVIAARQAPKSFPMMAIMRGSEKQKASLLEHSTAWQAYRVVPVSNMLGNRTPNPTELMWGSYKVGRTERVIPKTVPERICCLCGSSKVTKEHCTPNWLMYRMKLVPVTAQILCRGCNQSLGSDLERPFRVIYESQRLEHEPELTAKWAMKTAVMLSLASQVKVPKSLIYAVLARSASPGDTQVFSATLDPPEESFTFSLTHLGSELKRRGAFLCSLGFDRAAFLVVRWPDLSLCSIPRMRRISPYGPSVGLDLGLASGYGMHYDALHALTGEEFLLSDVPTARIPTPRQ